MKGDVVPTRDESLPHQINLMYDKDACQAVRVTCNCLATMNINKTRTYEFMPGFPKDTKEALAIYNDPKNHRLPFEPSVASSERVSDPEASKG